MPPPPASSFISQVFFYDQNTVQVVRYDNEVFYATSFFIFTDPDRDQLNEVLAYDGGGILRNRYVFEYDLNGNIILQEHFVYDPFNSEMVLNERIEQSYDNALNPLNNDNRKGWMEAWFLALYESSTFIENISREAVNNVLTRRTANRFGLITETVFNYQYDGYGYPLFASSITNGEFDARSYSYTYYD